MKKLLFSAAAVAAVVLLLAQKLPRYREKAPGSVQKVPSVLESYGEIETQGKNPLLVRTGQGRALVLLKGAHLLVMEDSEVEVAEAKVKLLKGRAELWGRAELELPSGAWKVNGRVFIKDGDFVCCEGRAEGKERLRAGQVFQDGKVANCRKPVPVRVNVETNILRVSLKVPSEVEVASEPFFVRPVLKKEGVVSLQHRLPNGLYYLRAFAQGALCCPVSETFQVRWLQEKLRQIDKTPPLLKATITAKGRVVIIKGQTEIGVRVFVNGEPVEVDSQGNFYCTLTFDTMGEHKISLKAVDEAGNVSRMEKTVIILGE